MLKLDTFPFTPALEPRSPSLRIKIVNTSGSNIETY